MPRKHPMEGKRRTCTRCKKRRIMVASNGPNRTEWVCGECRDDILLEIMSGARAARREDYV